VQNRWTEQQIEDAIRLYRRGDPISDIALHVGMPCGSTANKILRLRRVGRLEDRGIRRNGTEARASGLEEIAALYNSGMSWAAVSRHLGYKHADGAHRRFNDLLKRSSEPDKIKLREPAPVTKEEAPPPSPLWRDMGKGAQAEYDRAAARVERMVAAGDDRSAAINQVLMEMGVRVR
jgi:AraC-like DNA-binding protein